jgi:hypothetical protein
MNIRREDVLQKFLYKALKHRSLALKCSAVSLKMLYAFSLLFGAQKGIKKLFTTDTRCQ